MMNKLFRIYFSPESTPGENPKKGTEKPASSPALGETSTDKQKKDKSKTKS